MLGFCFLRKWCGASRTTSARGGGAFREGRSCDKDDLYLAMYSARSKLACFAIANGVGHLPTQLRVLRRRQEEPEKLRGVKFSVR